MWVYQDGQRLTAAMLHDFVNLDAEFFARTGQHLKIRSGVRTDQEQEDIWYDRMVTAGNIRGRHVYETRWWNGQMWYRISSAGTVAPPGSSNHQINVAAGRRGAIDIYDTGADAGVLTRGSFRARVFDEIAGKYGYDSEGYNFGETWHKRYNRDPWRAVPSPAGEETEPEEELPMNIQIVLHTPTNQLLLVDHLNRTIRNLGNSATDPVRDFYSRKPYTKMDDKKWGEATKGYQYITTPTSLDADLQARNPDGSPIKGAAFPMSVYIAAMDAKINAIMADVESLKNPTDK